MLFLTGPMKLRKAAKAGCIMTVVAAVLSILVSYRAIYLPRPWGEAVLEPIGDSGLFLEFGLKAVGICAASLALYLVVKRRQEKRAQKMTERRGRSSLKQ